jgi:hypothetical protein
VVMHKWVKGGGGGGYVVSAPAPVFKVTHALLKAFLSAVSWADHVSFASALTLLMISCLMPVTVLRICHGDRSHSAR